jgi:hypothetical protein
MTQTSLDGVCSKTSAMAAFNPQVEELIADPPLCQIHVLHPSKHAGHRTVDALHDHLARRINTVIACESRATPNWADGPTNGSYTSAILYNHRNKRIRLS